MPGEDNIDTNVARKQYGPPREKGARKGGEGGAREGGERHQRVEGQHYLES